MRTRSGGDEGTEVRVREVVGTVHAVDGDSLLSPQVLERIVVAVTRAMTAREADAESRMRDTRVDSASCGCGDGHGGGG